MTTAPFPPYHTNSDGSHNCTNCMEPIRINKQATGPGPIVYWIHNHGDSDCYGKTRPEVACPEAANDDDPDFYDERGWARA